MRVAVTGASGFIGGAVATRLADAGHDVVGFGRRPDGWSHPRAEYRRWDVTQPAPAELTSGPFDAVVHSAALADDWAPLAEALRVNRDGTRAVVAAFPGARIVHLSTSSVYDAFSPSHDIREDAPAPARYLSSYSESKALAEAELAGADAVVLRPHAVYGPGDTTLLPRVLEAIRWEHGRRGRLVLPNGGRALHSVTHLDNLVRAVELSLSRTAPSGVYNVADDAPVLLGDLLAELLARRGVEAHITGVPYRVAFALASAAERTAARRGIRPRLTRYAVSQLGLERTLDLTAARARLGYEPTATTLDGAETW